jgi:malate dehydrogenase
MAVAAIIGAGPTAGAIAHALARRGSFSSVLLVDAAIQVAAGKALDIQQAGPIEGSDTRLAARATPGEAGASDLVILADQYGPPALEWKGEPGLVALGHVRRAGHGGPWLFAGASSVWLMERAANELGLASDKLAGSAMLALEGALRAIMAVEADVSVLDVDAPVVGSPPDTVRVLWEQATVAGQPALSRLARSGVQRIEHRLRQMWPPGPMALGSAAALMATAMSCNARRRLTTLALVPAGANEPRVVAVPALLGPSGIRAVDTALLEGHPTRRFSLEGS